MLKKLRIKFIIVSMVATLLVLTAIISFINIRNYVNINETADRTLQVLKDNDGRFPMEKKEPPKGISPEAPYETRYFTVTFDSEGNVVAIDTKNIAAINDDVAKEYAEKLYAKNKEKGFIKDYKYVETITTNGDKMYIFLDCSKSLRTFREFLSASIIISIAGLFVVLVLVVIFSKIIMKPVAETYQKQKQFITDANHELKTPLTIINASCEILELEMNNTENEWTNTIKEQVARLTELTNKLVFLSKMDEENHKISMTDFSLSEVIEEAVKPYYTLVLSKGKKITTDIEANVTLNGDMEMIKQAISLLLDNAIKYSDEEGNITIKLSKSGRNKKIIVSNTTTGVPTGDLSQLFERFYRLDKSRNSETGGHGIGLSVVKSIINLHKGKIIANSNDGKTINFIITL